MSENRRAHSRIELYALAEIQGEGFIEVLTAHNLSEGGVFLSARSDDCPWLVIGTIFDLTIALAHEGSDPELLVQAKGRVVHRDGGVAQGIYGIGVAFEEIDGDNRAQLSAMLVEARSQHK